MFVYSRQTRDKINIFELTRKLFCCFFCGKRPHRNDSWFLGWRGFQIPQKSADSETCFCMSQCRGTNWSAALAATWLRWTPLFSNPIVYKLIISKPFFQYFLLLSAWADLQIPTPISALPEYLCIWSALCSVNRVFIRWKSINFQRIWSRLLSC